MNNGQRIVNKKEGRLRNGEESSHEGKPDTKERHVDFVWKEKKNQSRVFRMKLEWLDLHFIKVVQSFSKYFFDESTDNRLYPGEVEGKN